MSEGGGEEEGKREGEEGVEWRKLGEKVTTKHYSVTLCYTLCMYCILLHCVTLCYIVLHHITLHCATLVLHCVTLNASC